MNTFIQKIILKLFGNNPIIATIFISMIPIIELRGAIPFGSSKEIWGDKALTIVDAGLYSMIGSLISAVVVILLLIPIFKFLKKTKVFKKIALLFEEKFSNKSKKIEDNISNNKNKLLKKWLGTIAFVAIPLPLTGVWTGSAVAVFLQLGFLKGFSAVSIGAIIAALIMIAISTTLGDKALWIFYIFAIIFVALIIFYIIKALLFKSKDSATDDENK